MTVRSIWRDYSIPIAAFGIFGAFTAFFAAEYALGNMTSQWFMFFFVWDSFAVLVLSLIGVFLRRRMLARPSIRERARDERARDR